MVIFVTQCSNVVFAHASFALSLSRSLHPARCAGCAAYHAPALPLHALLIRHNTPFLSRTLPSLPAKYVSCACFKRNLRLKQIESCKNFQNFVNFVNLSGNLLDSLFRFHRFYYGTASGVCRIKKMFQFQRFPAHCSLFHFNRFLLRPNSAAQKTLQKKNNQK